MQPLFSIIVSVLGLFIGLHRGAAGFVRTTTGEITVSNGQIWGSWADPEMCARNTYAAGFTLKVEHNQGSGDDTALNGIAIHCAAKLPIPGPYVSYFTVRSNMGGWGMSTGNKWCTSGHLVAFQLKVEEDQHRGDDTAVNNIRFKCSNGEVLEGDGTPWGTWGAWSPVCTGKGICGIATKVEPPQGNGDDTALNDVKFYCCE